MLIIPRTILSWIRSIFVIYYCIFFFHFLLLLLGVRIRRWRLLCVSLCSQLFAHAHASGVHHHSYE